MDNTREKLAYLIVSDLPEKDQLANAEAADKLAEHLIANDVVPVVRCKDCKHFVASQGVPRCDNVYGLVFPHPNGYDFCSYGENKNDDLSL